ncbi:GntR family transcriptional regulator [Streptomyces sp. NPDC045456]|uniref:GntR family transcriptional regulator n=1 Tax=Streptomyces sp. NPDC045456 TaxID=3155254 RepID=UPI0033CAE2DF
MADRYEQIAADLRKQIEDGTLPAAARLPSESALAVQHRVGLPTVRHALNVLQAEGLIEKHHGRGTFVRAANQKIEYANNRHHRAAQPPDVSSSPQGRALDGSPEVTVSCCEVWANDELASRMNVQVETRLLELVERGRRPKDEAPYSIVRSYLLYAMAPPAPTELASAASPWGDASVDWLTEAGIEPDHIVERLTARPPSAREAAELGISPGVAVIAIQRTSYDARGTVVEAADLLMSGDRVAAVYSTPCVRTRQPY